MRKIVGLGVLAVLAVACVDELAEGAGEMLVDAGQVLADAGAALADAGNDAASAQATGDGGSTALPKSESFEVACDQKLERVVTYDTQPAGGTRTITTTTYFAVVNVDTADVFGVDARRCGHRVIGAHLKEICPHNATSCAGTVMPPVAECDTTSAADLLPTQIRIGCGSETHHANAAEPGWSTNDTGDSFKTAVVTVRYR